MTAPAKVADRLLSNYEIIHGCWVSNYSVGSHGYSQIGWWQEGKSRMVLGHRLSYEIHNGPIPDGMTVDHICHVRRCINPDHLQLLSNRDNGIKNHKGYNPTYCKRGHKRRGQDIGNQHGCYYCKRLWDTENYKRKQVA